MALKVTILFARHHLDRHAEPGQEVVQHMLRGLQRRGNPDAPRLQGERQDALNSR